MMIDAVVRILIVHRETTKQSIMDAVTGRTSSAMHNVRIEHSMDTLARTFSPENLTLLARLRALGHVSLEQAATALGFEDVLSFVEHAVDGLDRYLLFVPTPDGQPGICVPFKKLLIDLDLDESYVKATPEADIAFQNGDQRRQFFAAAEAGRVELQPGTWWRHMEAWEWGDKGVENGWTFEEMRRDACRILALEIEQLIGSRPIFERLLDAPWFNHVLSFIVVKPNPEKSMERFMTETMKVLYDPNDTSGNFRRLDAGIADAIGMKVSPLRLVCEEGSCD